ncbi:hypothetical protein JYK22_21560, partial [Nonomuraea sp. RK-328]|nr:hypothetical protein [Nonomuraea sp. RK-328]
VDRSGEGDIGRVEEFDADARELLEAAAPALADQVRAACVAELRALASRQRDKAATVRTLAEEHACGLQADTLTYAAEVLARQIGEARDRLRAALPERTES